MPTAKNLVWNNSSPHSGERQEKSFGGWQPPFLGHRRVKILFKCLENNSISPFYGLFVRMAKISAIFGCLKNFKLIEYECVLKWPKFWAFRENHPIKSWNQSIVCMIKIFKGGSCGGWGGGSSERCLKWGMGVIKRSFQKHLKTGGG